MNKSYTPLLSLVGMFLVIGVAYSLDNWIDHQYRVFPPELSGAWSWLVAAYLAILLLAGLLLGWLWLLYKKDPNLRLVAIVHILVGFGLLFYNVIAIAFAPRLLPMQWIILPKSLSAFVSAVVAVVGLQRLLVGRGR